MPIYRRVLSKGERWYFRGSYLAKNYCSKAIYLTRSEAKRAEAERLKELDDQARNPHKTNDMTLWDLTNKRLDYLELAKSKQYYSDSKRYFKKALDFFGEHIYISQITKPLIKDLIAKEAERLRKGKKTNHKVNEMIRALKALFNYAINELDTQMLNPLTGIKQFSIDIKLKYIPSDQEIVDLKAQCDDDEKLLIDFIYETACRVGEALKFKAEDKDGDLITLWTRKSKNSNLTPRRIPSPLCLNGIEFTERLFKRWETYPKFLEKKLRDMRENNPEIKIWGFHNLRHKRASLWANSNMPTYEIMTRLGHSNISTTMGYLRILGFTRL